MGDSDGPGDQNADQASQVESEMGLHRAKSPPIFSDTTSLTGSTGVAFSTTTPPSRGFSDEGSKESRLSTSLEQQSETESVASAHSAYNEHPGPLRTHSRSQSLGCQSTTSMLPTDRGRPSPKRSTYTGRPEKLRAPPVSMLQRPISSRDGYSSQAGSSAGYNKAASRSNSSSRGTGFPGLRKQPTLLKQITVTSSPNTDARGGMMALIPASFRSGAFRSNSPGTRSNNNEALMKTAKQSGSTSTRTYGPPALAAAPVPRKATKSNPGRSSSVRSFSLPREPQQRHPHSQLQHCRSRSSSRTDYVEQSFVAYDAGDWTPPPAPPQSQSAYTGTGRSFSLGGDGRKRPGAGGATAERHYHTRGAGGRGSEGAYIPTDTAGGDGSLAGVSGQHCDIAGAEGITRPMSRGSRGSSGHFVADGGSVEYGGRGGWSDEGEGRTGRRRVRGVDMDTGGMSPDGRSSYVERQRAMQRLSYY